MSIHKVQESEVRSQNTERMRRRRGVSFLLLTLGCLSLFVGCRMDMQDQPKLKAYRKGSIRKPVAGTVARGYLREDKQLYTGKKEQSGVASTSVAPPRLPTVIDQPSATTQPAMALYPDMVDTFPFPITDKIVTRGEERFNAFCSMCHGPTGYGDGMIVRRGFRRPPSYHTDQLRQAPVGHFFDVITNGWGAMPPHAAMIPVTDRWAIIAYVRALQLSQNPQGTTQTTSKVPAVPDVRGERTGRR
jgi:mono/diheme cytochrome c family protein